MKEFWNTIQLIFTAIGGWLGWFLGGCDGLLYALIAFVAIDYMQGLALWQQRLRRLWETLLHLSRQPIKSSFTVYARPGRTANRRKVRSVSLPMRRNAPIPTKVIPYLMKMAKRYIRLMHQTPRNPLTPSPVKLSVVIGAMVMNESRNSLPQDMIILLCRKK